MLREKISAMSNPFDLLGQSRPHLQETAISSTADSNVWTVLETSNKRLDALTQDISILNSCNDADVAKFGGLGFNTVADAGAWLETHAAGEGYGWIYDYDTLMQAVHTTFSGEDLIKRLSNCDNLKIEAGHQAATIAAFKTSMPRYFCANPTQNLVQKD